MSRMPRIATEGRRRSLLVVVMCALLQAFSAGVTAFATREVFVLLGGGRGALPVGALWAIFLGACGIALFRWSGGVAAERLGHDYASSLRLRLFRHIARLPSGEHARHRVGGMSLRFVGDLTAVRQWVSLGLARMIAAAIVVPSLFLVLLLIQPAFAALALLPVVAGLFVIAWLGRGLIGRHRRLRSQRSRLASDVAERLTVAPQLRLMGRIRLESAVLARRSRHLAEAGVSRQRLALLMSVTPDVAGGVAAALLLFATFGRDLPSADAAAGLAVLALLLQPLRELAHCWDRYCAWHTAKERCERLLAQRRLPLRREAAPARSGPMAVRLVRRVNGERRVLKIAPGEVVALKGASGSGKSTLLRQLAGVEVMRRGKVLLDGAAATAQAGTPGAGVALIAADTPILAGSLRRALTLGVSPRPSDADIRRVAMEFGLASLLQREGGLELRVADGGRNLSSGERRRILLARAVLSGARLLLLDEPERDLASEARQLLTTLLRHCQGVTTVFFSREPALLKQAGQIWVIRRDGVIDVSVPSDDKPDGVQ